METLFKISSLFVLPFWALMIFLPHWRVTRRLMSSWLVPMTPAVLYTVLVIPRFIEIWRGVSKPELQTIAALLGTSEGATIAWLHFLAFDLFVGRWIYLDSRERGMSVWLMAPVLYLTLMLGPLGFLLYVLLRQARGHLFKSAEAVTVSTVSK